MFLIKFFYFLKGYVIIEVYDKSVWELINQASENNIKLYNITSGEKISFALMADDFYDLYTMASKLGIKLKIKKEHSINNLLFRYKRRIGFFAGAMLFIVAFCISSRFLIDITVETDGKLPEETVLELLGEIGVRPGVLLKNLPDGITMKNHLVNSLENVPWAWVYVNGTRARVQIHEGTVPPVVVDDDVSCDIIASKDGFITEMYVKKGMPLCTAGSAVNAGEVLVSGLVEVGPEENKKYYTVHSDGEIMAYTHYELTGEYNLFEERPEFTGKEKNVYDLTLFGKHMRIFKEPDYDYSVCTKKQIFSGFGINLVSNKHMEAEKNTVQLTEEWVTEFAKRDLSAQISERLGPFARLQSEDYLIERGNKSIRVTARMDFIENIGVTVPRQ